MAKKKRIALTKNEFSALQHFLEIAYSDYEHSDTETGEKACKEIEKLKEKLSQIELQQRGGRLRPN